ncbi:MAG: cobalamin biosynthesis protein CbiM [Gracilibacter sp. BRH_c7a]|nr:MAG: cobalamin biosynthesis protein CbiM [Gracilibacter sp. BRH_c7a]
MHIPDGFLDVKTAATAAVVSAVAISYSIKQTREVLDDRQIPMMGVAAAFIFAAQMVNFPVAGGTSGHLIGGTLAAITFGPWAAMLIMSAVLIIQSFVFQDGGISALGGNILLMAVVAPLVGYFVYSLLMGSGESRKRVLASTFVAGWISTISASLVCAILLSISNIVSIQVAVPAMLGWHTLIGIGEGLVTAFVVSYLTKVKPGMVRRYRVNTKESVGAM